MSKKKKKKRKKLANYKFQFLMYPGKSMNDEELSHFVREIRDTVSTCFEKIPEYQVMIGTREEMSDKVISVAWRKDGKIAGFCSTVILKVDGVGDVQHLGLTCVRPEDRSNGLTHILTHKAVAGYLMRNKPIIGKLWVSNCAAVLSSLVNVSLHFEQVYPSPFPKVKLTDAHRRIAKAIDKYYRDKIYIDHGATFDWDAFVFRGSVKDTVFQKEENDSRYYHRNQYLNDYYKDIMMFDNGDEVLQVGYASTLVAIKHSFRKLPIPRPGMKQQKEQVMRTG